MPKIDLDLINRKLSLIQDDLSILKNFKDITLDDYLKDQNSQLSVERLLERISGRVIDLNYHILKSEYETIPVDYYTSFIEIAKNKIIDEDFAHEIAKMTGLRNALAHDYDKLDQNKIHSSIGLVLLHVPTYLKKVLDFIKQPEGQAVL